jgi:hypothetical protein
MKTFGLTIFTILIILTLIPQFTVAESIGDYQFIGDGNFNNLIFEEIQSINAYTTYQSSNAYDWNSYTYSGYSNPLPPTDLGQYPDAISAINAYNRYYLGNEITTTHASDYSNLPQQYQSITPQNNYETGTTMKTRSEIVHGQRQYITPNYQNEVYYNPNPSDPSSGNGYLLYPQNYNPQNFWGNDVTMRSLYEYQNGPQHQYITPNQRNQICYRADPSSAEVCS